MSDNELAAPTTDRGGPDHAPSCPIVCCTSPYDPDVIGPYTDDEFDSLMTSVWSLEEDDPTRFDELLSHAIGFIARLALEGDNGFAESNAAVLLRSMEQRALWGPDHPVRQP